MEIITPTDYVGPLMELAQARRGDFKDMTYLTETRTTLVYDMPLAEVRHSRDFSSSVTVQHASLGSNACSTPVLYEPQREILSTLTA